MRNTQKSKMSSRAVKKGGCLILLDNFSNACQSKPCVMSDKTVQTALTLSIFTEVE